MGLRGKSYTRRRSQLQSFTSRQGSAVEACLSLSARSPLAAVDPRLVRRQVAAERAAAGRAVSHLSPTRSIAPSQRQRRIISSLHFYSSVRPPEGLNFSTVNPLAILFTVFWVTAMTGPKPTPELLAALLLFRPAGSFERRHQTHKNLGCHP